MAKVSIIVGQSASLSKQIMEKYSLTMIPFVVDWKSEKSNLNPESIFQKMADSEENGSEDLPKTSHPAPWLFKSFFEEKLKNSDSVLFVSLSSKLSATFESANTGKEMLNPSLKEKVFLFDSQNVSAGEGLIAIKAAEIIGQGKSIQKAVEELQDFKQKICSAAIVENIKWLEKGGRAKGLSKLALPFLQKTGANIVLKIKNGKIEPAMLSLKNSNQASAVFNFFKKDKNRQKARVAITYAQNEQEAKDLKNLILKEFPETEIAFVCPIDNIIGIHTGPNALICAWHPLE
ncbi:MAG: DegV family protein [Candidatus Paceibacterota bacterium]|jgi:DegV family protein with EDD domain